MHAIYYIIPFVGFYCHATTRGKIREKKNIDVSNNSFCAFVLEANEKLSNVYLNLEQTHLGCIKTTYHLSV